MSLLELELGLSGTRERKKNARKTTGLCFHPEDINSTGSRTAEPWAMNAKRKGSWFMESVNYLYRIRELIYQEHPLYMFFKAWRDVRKTIPQCLSVVQRWSFFVHVLKQKTKGKGRNLTMIFNFLVSKWAFLSQVLKSVLTYESHIVIWSLCLSFRSKKERRVEELRSLHIIHQCVFMHKLKVGKLYYLFDSTNLVLVRTYFAKQLLFIFLLSLVNAGQTF